jgi:putative membrane protein
MNGLQRRQLTNVALFALASSHALVTWPLRATVALFVGGMGIAFVLEVLGVSLGLFRHRFRPQIASVPVTILLAWPAVIYLSHRLALLVTPAAIPAAALTAMIATAADALVEPAMVDGGAWEYPETVVSRPRIRGIPWWNFVAWSGIAFATAFLPTFVTG